MTKQSSRASLRLPSVPSRVRPASGFFVAFALSLAAFAGPAAAQDAEEMPPLEFPVGWEVRFDREGPGVDDLYLVSMPPGLHVTTGPAHIAWHPDSTASGDFRIESETFMFDPEGRREAFGFFVGGSDLHGPGQAYTYFLVRDGGEFLVKRRHGTETSVVQDWTAHSAVESWAGKSGNTAKNVLVLEAEGAQLRFFVNGEQVWTGARGDLAIDGHFGLRVNHGLDLHVTTIGRTEAGSS